MAVQNDIHPKDRILVTSQMAADLLSMSYTEFRSRVREGEIPIADQCLGDRFSVDWLRQYYSAKIVGLTAPKKPA